MICRRSLVLHLEGVRMLIISRIDGVHHNTTYYRLVEIMNKTLRIYIEI